MSKHSTARKTIREIFVDANPRHFLIAVFLLALALRLSVMFVRSSYYFIDYGDDHFDFGWEMGRVARSLAEGQGFASPMPLPTGPTAIVGPIYPILLAAIFKLFGVYTTASAVVILVLQCFFSSLTCFFVYLCGRDTVGEITGKLAAIIWAVFPLSIFFTVTRIWETSVTPTLVAILFWYMLPLRHSASASRWVGTGALLAIAVLINTSLIVLVVPFLVEAVSRNGLRLWRPAMAAMMTFAALVSPWLIRNYVVFGKIMLRSNFPLEFRVGNNELSPGQKVESLHPAKSTELNERWQELGELRFMAEEQDLNSRFIAAHPASFAYATLNRIVNYWTGAWIAPSRDFPNIWPVIFGTSTLSILGMVGIFRMWSRGYSAVLMYTFCLILYPSVYYITTSQPRFYQSITPLLIVPSAFWLVSWKKSRGPQTRDSGFSSSAVCGQSIGLGGDHLEA